MHAGILWAVGTSSGGMDAKDITIFRCAMEWFSITSWGIY